MRKLLTIDGLRDMANDIGEDRGNEDGLCPDVRFTPTRYAEGVRNDLGANWTVVVLNCTPSCAGFWQRILEDLARDYDVDFDAPPVRPG
ncbi:MAG: hypothetical protein ABI645_00500 [Pseudomonadota bacterium]